MCSFFFYFGKRNFLPETFFQKWLLQNNLFNTEIFIKEKSRQSRSFCLRALTLIGRRKFLKIVKTSFQGWNLGKHEIYFSCLFWMTNISCTQSKSIFIWIQKKKLRINTFTDLLCAMTLTWTCRLGVNWLQYHYLKKMKNKTFDEHFRLNSLKN